MVARGLTLFVVEGGGVGVCVLVNLGSGKNDSGPVLFLLFGDMNEGENMEWWCITACVQCCDVPKQN